MTSVDLHAPHTAPLTLETLAEAARGLPLEVRLALQVCARLAKGQLTVRVPDGRSFVFKGSGAGPEATMVINDHHFARRILRNGDLGVAEGYLRGEWSSPELPAFLELFCVNAEEVNGYLMAKPLYRALQSFRHWMNRNTKTGSRRNIEAHYDLGNRFYAEWLDPSMTYSSALFEGTDGDLSAAQRRKYEALAQAIDLKTGEHVLEIGCGWGGFAEFAAKEVGARVTGLTISPSQLEFARKRIFEAGLADKVELKLEDYRDERGTYDRIASIEMFEAVGEEYWPAFFSQMRERLKPGGAAGVQVITIQDRFFETYKREVDFIQHYIFPGGMLPSPAKLQGLAQSSGLRIAAERIFGLDYAETLSQWRRSFLAAWPTIEPLGFDERFKRLWEYYLSYCEAGFRSENIDVRQIVFARG
jgi:cyclopropane-fatty-acyl-phospholipid synthase